MRQLLLFLVLSLASAGLASPALAATIGFEAAEGYTLAPLCPASGGQQGWSGGAQAGCTNNDPGDEQVVNTEFYDGSNSWHYARGYGSSGQGTPFSPTLGSVAGPGTRFEFSIHFKAASSTGDASEQSIYIGSEAGNDRTGFNIYLTNDSAGDGLHLFTYGDSVTSSTLAVNLDRTAWHEVSVVAVFDADPDNDVFEYSVHGSLVFTGNSWPNPWRIDNGHTPAYGDSIKFADEGGDTLAHSGFYYDAMSYDVSNIPEPHTALLLLAGLGGLAAALRRRRRLS